MSDKMLIDASHREETRVVVTRGSRIEEFDFESEHKKQLKGNIYLARVTRVEPSLQAAFVEYGGNRHGFLAFSEIHPDYYQIPVADRQALVEVEARAVMREHERETSEGARLSVSLNRGRKAGMTDMISGGGDEQEIVSEIKDEDEAASDGDHSALLADDESADNIEIVGAEDVLEEVAHYQYDYRRDYKIQEVIKRRQIILVQVAKEERGNKGAALTTYLSLAGRYSVLMPNTARGGGISRKITNLSDRKRLKEIVADLDVPKGMGVILRTAGANRTKAEIRRDYEYLMRLWESVRSLTLSSIAPALVHEEGSLIKRSIRDLYNKDIGEVLVAGEEGYREAKDFMRMLMPSHAKVVQPYRDSVPIFSRNGIESQLDRMLQPEVSLKSGGYLVINQTEALVAIDINSGRSTREHSVEDTALQTNLEAADEIARQLRLRDLAGLVVIDFIDMDERRHVRAVEKKLKDCLKEDRARIQVGHISHFGLLEMSRQRLRASVLESTTQICPHCNGTGYVRSQSSLALHVVRSIEEYLLRNRGYDIIVRTPTETALYVLNHKRQMLADFEVNFGLRITIEADNTLGGQHLAIDRGEAATSVPTQPDPVSQVVEIAPEEDKVLSFQEDAESAMPANAEREQEGKETNGRRRKNKKRGRVVSSRTGEKEDGRLMEMQPVLPPEVVGATPEIGSATEVEEGDRKRRRGRRSGRRGRDYDSRMRLPWPEPVGPYAASAQAAARHLRKSRYAPHAEPVGSFFAQVATDIANDGIVDMMSIKDLPEPSVSVADVFSDAVLEEPIIAPEVIPADVLLPEGTSASGQTATEEIVEEPARKRRGRPKKMLETDKVASAAVPADDGVVLPVVQKPQRRRSAKVGEEGKAPEVTTKDAEKTDKKKVARKPAERNPKKKAQTLDAIPLPTQVQGDASAADIDEEAVVAAPIDAATPLPAPEKPRRMGWWQRKGFF